MDEPPASVSLEPPAVQREPRPEGQLEQTARQPEPPPTDLLGLYLAEGQMILKNAYQSFFFAAPTINLLGATQDTSTMSLVEVLEEHQPQVLLVGVKALRA